MKIMMLFLGFLMFDFVNTAYHPSEMCFIAEYKYKGKTGEIEDCSFQFPAVKEKICNVFARKVCTEKTSELWNNTVDLETQSDAKFSVEVIPYTAMLVFNLPSPTGGGVQGPPVSAINITFIELNKDVTGLAFYIKDDLTEKMLCRLMDFKNYHRGINVPGELFYDCLYHMTEKGIQNVTMTFVSLPTNESLSYYVFIPPPLKNNTLCSWKPLIMVFKKGLDVGVVHAKFSTAPQHFNVSSYLVELVNNSSLKRITEIVSSGGKMITVEFPSVEEGYYYISVKPLNLKNSTCSFTNTRKFYVTPPYSIGRALILVVSSFILLVVCLVAILKCCHMYYNQELPYKRVLFVYSKDCLVHEQFISSFRSYLVNSYKMSVSTIYGEIEDPIKGINTSPRLKDPKEWIINAYKNSDIIIFIISEGLFISLQEGLNIRVQEMSHWLHQPSKAKNYISLQIFHSPNALKKKFCIVCFPYSNQIPPCLSDIGRGFKLPNEMKTFLCFLFDCKPFIPFTNIYPKLSRNNPLSLIKKKEFWKKMEIVQRAVENKTNVVKIKKTFKFEPNSNGNNYLSVNCEDPNSCDKNVSSDDHGQYLKGWEEYLRDVYNASENANCKNDFTPIIEQELE